MRRKIIAVWRFVDEIPIGKAQFREVCADQPRYHNTFCGRVRPYRRQRPSADAKLADFLVGEDPVFFENQTAPPGWTTLSHHEVGGVKEGKVG